MPTFLCERCGAIENTATSDYWLYKLDNKPVLCSKCSTGKWHDRFPRQHWSSVGIDELLRAQKRNQGDFINARSHLKDMGLLTLRQLP